MKKLTLNEIALKAYAAGRSGHRPGTCWTATDPGYHALLFPDGNDAWETWASEYERGQREYCADGMSDLWTGMFN